MRRHISAVVLPTKLLHCNKNNSWYLYMPALTIGTLQPHHNLVGMPNKGVACPCRALHCFLSPIMFLIAGAPHVLKPSRTGKPQDLEAPLWGNLVGGLSSSHFLRPTERRFKIPDWVLIVRNNWKTTALPLMPWLKKPLTDHYRQPNLLNTDPYCLCSRITIRPGVPTQGSPCQETCS